MTSDQERSLIFSRISAFGVLLIFVFLFQTVFAHNLCIGGIIPSILIPAAISVGMNGGIKAGPIFGCILGLLCDATVGKVFGYQAFILLIAGFAAGFLVETLMWDKMLGALVAYIGVYVVIAVGYILTALFITGNFKEMFIDLTEFLLKGAYSTVFIPPCFLICRRIKRAYYEDV